MTSSTKLQLSAAARQDIDHILQHALDAGGSDVLDSYKTVLDEALRRLREFPGFGLMHADGIRRYTIQRHEILYRYERSAVIILRVIHPRHLRDH